MSFAASVLILALTWALITGAFTVPNLLFGAVIGALASLLLRDRVQRPVLYREVGRVLSLFWLLCVELMLSALKVAALVIRPRLKQHLRPAIIAFPLTAKTDAQIALLANLITLTPGTLSIDVSEDRSTLFVHVLTLTDKEALIADIRNGFESKVMEVLR